MKQAWATIAWQSLLLAIVFSSLSLLVVGQADVAAENKIVHNQQGVNVYCDKSRGSAKNLCVGEYSRGWPIAEAHGALVLSTSSQVNHRLQFNVAKSLLNKAVYFVPSLLIVLSIRKLRRL